MTAVLALAGVLAGCDSNQNDPEDSGETDRIGDNASPGAAPPPLESSAAGAANDGAATDPQVPAAPTAAGADIGGEPLMGPPRATLDSDQVPAVLKAAALAREQGDLRGGPESASTRYQQVLASAPDNVAAQRGLEGVVSELLRQADEAIETGNADRAGAIAIELAKMGDARATELGTRVRRLRAIESLLAAADEHRRAGRLFAPEVRNAAEVYRTLLLEYPEDPRAALELRRIESDLIASALAAATEGDYAQAERLIADAGKAQPGSRGVQDANTRIVELRQARALELAEQARQALADNELSRAEQLITQVEAVSAQAQLPEELRQSLEHARLYRGRAPGELFSDRLSGGGMGPRLAVIPAGSFVMGAAEADPSARGNELPAHQVRFRRGFALAVAETTVAQYRTFLERSGYIGSASQRRASQIYDEKSGRIRDRRGVGPGDDFEGEKADPALPVVHVSWEDASAYVDWLSHETGQRYRLPTEAEFEYALRAGGQDIYPWGNGAPPGIVANLTGDGDESRTRRRWSNAFADYADGFWGPAPTRTFPANRFGVHGLIGNVSEWTMDCWHDGYRRAPVDGSAWVNPGCSKRVVRGASWASAPAEARAAFRVSARADVTSPRIGFRVVREL